MDATAIHITGTQALKLMRAARAGQIVTAVKADEPRIAMPPRKLLSVDDLGIGELMTWLDISRDDPLHVMVPSVKRRSWLSSLHTSVFSTDLPPNSMLELKQLDKSHSPENDADDLPDPLQWDPHTRIFFDAPPLAMLHAARTLQEKVSHADIGELEARLRLIALACELCGSYARDPLAPHSGSCYYDEPETCNRFVTPDELRKSLGQLYGVRGSARARMAAEHALDFSGSPMETYIDLGFFLPPRLGGVSMHGAVFNQQLQVPNDVRSMLRHKSLRPDIQWPEQHMLGEYLGDEEHAGKAARIEDKNRIQDYATARYAPVFLMYDDVRSVADLNKTAKRIARMLMQRGVKNELYRVNEIMRSEGFHDRQNMLGKVLLPPIGRYE